MVKRVFSSGALPIHWSVILTVILFILLGATAAWQFFYAPEYKVEAVIATDLRKLAEAFRKIESDVNITGIKNQHDNIDFLNVKSFVGSEVGPLNVAHPENWRGPYMTDNPTIRGAFYQIVRTHKGYFMVPGNGVQLTNGAVIGKDVVLDEQADIEQMMHDPKKLFSAGKEVAIKLPISLSIFDELMREQALLSDDVEG